MKTTFIFLQAFLVITRFQRHGRERFRVSADSPFLLGSAHQRAN
jgi:hypothetical protein